MASFKLFITLNAKIWWRSVKKGELLAIFFYGLFLLLIFFQFVQVALLFLTAENAVVLQEIYPWFDENAWILFHVALINLVWFMQFGFTKMTRLQLAENKKLIALGFPLKKVVQYINLTGFLHPLNLLFHLFWLIYFSSLTNSKTGLLVAVLFIPVSYLMFIIIKWKFHKILDKISAPFKWIGGILLFVITVLALAGDQIFTLENPEELIPQLLGVFAYTPGMLFYSMFTETSSTILTVVSLLMIVSLVWMFIEVSQQTRKALVTPFATGTPDDSKSLLRHFITVFGHEGGKSQFYIWSHPYAQTQAGFALLFPAFYLLVVADGTLPGINYIVPMFFTMMPVIVSVVMISNLFGFENRELLLSLQFPVKRTHLLAEKLNAAFLVGAFVATAGFVGVLYFFKSPVHLIQVMMGITLIFLIFFNYLMKRSLLHYKKIESVSMFSMSNPVVAQSVSFLSIFGILILSVLVFPVYESIQLFHISAIIAANVYVLIVIRRNLKKFPRIFKRRLIPELWNEL